MGIKKLNLLIQCYAPDSLTQQTLNHYKYKRLAIDGSIYLRKFVYEGWEFENIKNERIEKWKSVVKKMEKMKDSDNSEYITMGFREVVDETISSLFQPSDTHIHIKILQNIISCKHSEVEDIMKSTFEDAEALRLIESLTEVMQKQQTQLIRLLFLINEIAIKSQTKEIPLSIPLEKVNIEDVITVKRKTVIQTLSVDKLKTIVNLTDEQIFKKRYPNFKPSADNIKLKKEMEDMVKMALKDVVSMDHDKTVTRVRRGITQMEYRLVESLLTGKLSSNIMLEIEAENDNLMKSLGRCSIKVTWKMYNECRKFLKVWGIPCIVSEGYEAEALCASLTTHGLADASVSEDTDTILYGEGPVVRKFLTKREPIQEVSPVKIRKLLNLSHDEFLDLCILCGTDFSGTIRGIGPIKALEMIKSYGTIENIIPNLKSDNIYDPSFMKEVKSAKKIFKNPPTISSKFKNSLEEKKENAEFPKLLEQFQIDTS
ncbi:17784_t:CDS:2 [Dentiscutata erythropus]|uniref:17784_t:CDS:1 n=1 Tax=Dentiscutata erythropus TaxID=1348616 RepID=A0A9N9FKW0_9GLOM|nr:17784_t:CDS:2 [Dentiscutata erythropus]